MYEGIIGALSARSYALEGGRRGPAPHCTFCISHNPGLPLGLKPKCSSAVLVSQRRAMGSPSCGTRRSLSCPLLSMRKVAKFLPPGTSSSAPVAAPSWACFADGKTPAESPLGAEARPPEKVSGGRRSSLWKSSRLAGLCDGAPASNPEALPSSPPELLPAGGPAIAAAAPRQHNAQLASVFSGFALLSME